MCLCVGSEARVELRQVVAAVVAVVVAVAVSSRGSSGGGSSAAGVIAADGLEMYVILVLILVFIFRFLHRCRLDAVDIEDTAAACGWCSIITTMITIALRLSSNSRMRCHGRRGMLTGHDRHVELRLQPCHLLCELL